MSSDQNAEKECLEILRLYFEKHPNDDLFNRSSGVLSWLFLSGAWEGMEGSDSDDYKRIMAGIIFLSAMYFGNPRERSEFCSVYDSGKFHQHFGVSQGEAEMFGVVIGKQFSKYGLVPAATHLDNETRRDVARNRGCGTQVLAIVVLVIIVILLATAGQAEARGPKKSTSIHPTPKTPGATFVKSYIRRDGTVVGPHFRGIPGAALDVPKPTKPGISRTRPVS